MVIVGLNCGFIVTEQYCWEGIFRITMLMYRTFLVGFILPPDWVFSGLYFLHVQCQDLFIFDFAAGLLVVLN